MVKGNNKDIITNVLALSAGLATFLVAWQGLCNNSTSTILFPICIYSGVFLLLPGLEKRHSSPSTAPNAFSMRTWLGKVSKKE